MKIRQFLLFCLMLVALFSCSCESTAGTDFAYREENFRAEIRGNLNGVAVTAILEQAQDAGGGRVITLRYASPAALEGVTVTYQNGSLALSQGDLHPTRKDASIGDLAEPILLLLVREFAVTSVQKSENETVLGLRGEAEIVLDPTGHPIRFSSPSCSMFTVWWESP